CRDFALRFHGEILFEVAVCDCGDDFHDAAYLLCEICGHYVHGVGEVLPGTGDARHPGLPAKQAFGADVACDTPHFRGKGVELVDHRIDRVLQFENFALYVDGNLARQVATRHGGGHFGNITDLCGEVCRQQVHVVGQVLPGAGHTRHIGLTAEAALGADFARDARHFPGERAQLVRCCIERFLELQQLAAHVHGDLLGQVAVCNGGRYFGDVASLRGQVRCHEVDVVGQVLPGSGDFRHLSLATQLAFSSDFARDARHFRCKRIELIHHRVDGVLQLENLALHVHGDLAREVAARDGRGDF